jgi:hypothetical protein
VRETSAAQTETTREACAAQVCAHLITIKGFRKKKDKKKEEEEGEKEEEEVER